MRSARRLACRFPQRRLAGPRGHFFPVAFGDRWSCFSCWGPCNRRARYTPESPEVRQLLGKALKYLDESGKHPRLGGKALVGLALLKGGRPTDHPRIQLAVQACQAAAAEIRESHSSDVMYDLAISIIFLCELDADQYREEIRTLMTVMLDWQKEFGGWGYLEGVHSKKV